MSKAIKDIHDDGFDDDGNGSAGCSYAKMQLQQIVSDQSLYHQTSSAGAQNVPLDGRGSGVRRSLQRDLMGELHSPRLALDGRSCTLTPYPGAPRATPTSPDFSTSLHNGSPLPLSEPRRGA